VPQTLANLIKSGSDLIALPWRSKLHAIPDFVQAFAHPPAMLAPPFPFLTVARTSLRAWTVARTSLRAWPLDLNEMAVDASFLFQGAGVRSVRQRGHGEKAGSENGYERSHATPLTDSSNGKNGRVWRAFRNLQIFGRKWDPDRD